MDAHRTVKPWNRPTNTPPTSSKDRRGYRIRRSRPFWCKLRKPILRRRGAEPMSSWTPASTTSWKKRLLQVVGPIVRKCRESSHRPLKAIFLKEFGGPEVLRLEDVPAPQPAAAKLCSRFIPFRSIAPWILSSAPASIGENSITPRARRRSRGRSRGNRQRRHEVQSRRPRRCGLSHLVDSADPASKAKRPIALTANALELISGAVTRSLLSCRRVMQ